MFEVKFLRQKTQDIGGKKIFKKMLKKCLTNYLKYSLIGEHRCSRGADKSEGFKVK